MDIRLAMEKDVERIAKVHVKSWQQTYKGIISQDYLDSLKIEDKYELWKRVISTSSEESPVIVAENSGGEIVGFASFGRERMQRFGVDGELYAIYLLEEYKRKKLGTKLYYHGLKEIMKTGIESLLVWVIEDNPSRRFYDKFFPEQIGQESFEINGRKHIEIAYAWRNLPLLINRLESYGRDDRNRY